jgi:hypothetical protein
MVLLHNLNSPYKLSGAVHLWLSQKQCLQSVAFIFRMPQGPRSHSWGYPQAQEPLEVMEQDTRWNSFLTQRLAAFPHWHGPLDLVFNSLNSKQTQRSLRYICPLLRGFQGGGEPVLLLHCDQRGQLTCS